MGKRVVRGPEKERRETPCDPPVPDHATGGPETTRMEEHLLLCGSFSVVASYLTIFNHINNCQKSVYSSIRKTYLPTL